MKEYNYLLLTNCTFLVPTYFKIKYIHEAKHQNSKGKFFLSYYTIFAVHHVCKKNKNRQQKGDSPFYSSTDR